MFINTNILSWICLKRLFYNKNLLSEKKKKKNTVDSVFIDNGNVCINLLNVAIVTYMLYSFRLHK